MVSALGAWHGGFAAGPLLAAIPQVCFSDDCQAQVDRVFAAAVGVPLLVFVVSVALIVTGKPEEKEGSFRDPETGAVFEAAEGASPERDTKGELAFRPVGYTPWPVEEGAPGERIRVDVGTVGAVAPRTFVFERTLPQPR